MEGADQEEESAISGEEAASGCAEENRRQCLPRGDRIKEKNNNKQMGKEKTKPCSYFMLFKFMFDIKILQET